MSDTPRILVTGASGQLGRAVLAELTARGARPIAGSRHPETLDATGLDTRTVDFDAPETLERAFAGIDRLLLISTDRIDVPGRRLAQHRAAVAAARAAGVGHVVYTSMLRPDAQSPIPFAPDHAGTEAALAEAGLAHTVLRNSWYSELLLQSLPQVLASGRWFYVDGDGRANYVTRADCAATAAGVLLAEAPPTGIFDVTGPAALTVPDIAALASAATGRPIETVPVGDEDYRRGLLGAGLPEPVAALILALGVNHRQGRSDIATDTVQRLAGRASTGVDAFLRQHRDALRGESGK